MPEGDQTLSKGTTKKEKRLLTSLTQRSGQIQIVQLASKTGVIKGKGLSDNNVHIRTGICE